MTPAELFDKALDERWANHPDRHSNGRYFWEAACEVYMQEHVLHWGWELRAFDPDDMKMLGRWLAKCENGRTTPDSTPPPSVCPTCGSDDPDEYLTACAWAYTPDPWHQA